MGMYVQYIIICSRGCQPDVKERDDLYTYRNDGFQIVTDQHVHMLSNGCLSEKTHCWETNVNANYSAKAMRILLTDAS